MKTGYDIFGKAYGVMLRNDLHASESVDHKFLREMILLDAESAAFLYGKKPEGIDMRTHELYSFAQRFRGRDDHQTVENILAYTSQIAKHYDVEFEQMLFGGTEKQILERGTDWCADMARVGAVLLVCNGIPARILHLANPERAYNGHVVVEAFYEGKYGVCDFIYGYCFYDREPLDAETLQRHEEYLAGYREDYRGLYCLVGINEYDPTDADNNYTVSTPNEYTKKIIETDHQDRWFMGEEGQEE